MRNKTVLITGSSKGLGKELAYIFAKHGFNVIIHGRNVKSLIKVRSKILQNKVRCWSVVGDLVHQKTVDDLFVCAKEHEVDILINNAGMYLRKHLVDMCPNEFRNVLDVNLVAPVLITKMIYPLLARKKKGLIININSIAGKGFSDGEAAYCASKHGLKGFMGCFKYEATKHSVAVTDIFLGAMNTAMTADRKETKKLIQIDEVARFVYSLSQDYMSMRINEVDIVRRNY